MYVYVMIKCSINIPKYVIKYNVYSDNLSLPQYIKYRVTYDVLSDLKHVSFLFLLIHVHVYTNKIFTNASSSKVVAKKRILASFTKESHR